MTKSVNFGQSLSGTGSEGVELNHLHMLSSTPTIMAISNLVEFDG